MADNLSSFVVYKDGEEVGTIHAHDAREVGPVAVERWGGGIYEVKLHSARSHYCWGCGAHMRFCSCDESYSRDEDAYVSRCIGAGNGHE